MSENKHTIQLPYHPFWRRAQRPVDASKTKESEGPEAADKHRTLCLSGLAHATRIYDHSQAASKPALLSESTQQFCFLYQSPLRQKAEHKALINRQLISKQILSDKMILQFKQQPSKDPGCVGKDCLGYLAAIWRRVLFCAVRKPGHRGRLHHHFGSG